MKRRTFLFLSALGLMPGITRAMGHVCQAPYFWPNPKTRDGLPYIRKDGERNPEINKITDHCSLDQMVAAVETLALAYYFKGDERYAAKAVNLLRAFFLDPSMRTNPNLQFAQSMWIGLMRSW